MTERSAESLKKALNLVPLSIEGGYFAETYRSAEVLPAESLRGGYSGARSACTAIYYLLEPGTFSEMHRVKSDEIFHFYLGDPVEMVQLWPDGSHRVITIGTEIERGMRPQVVAPRGVWQGTRLLSGGQIALLGCTVSPGFEYDDYESGKCVELVKQYPTAREFIETLTRS
jgi:predicted cupin superfamily sugar epimerase